MIEAYQWWWEEKRDGLWDSDTCMMKVCGASDEGEAERRVGVRKRMRKMKKEMAMRGFLNSCLVQRQDGESFVEYWAL